MYVWVVVPGCGGDEDVEGGVRRCVSKEVGECDSVCKGIYR